MKRIPLHSLIILIGPAGAGKSHLAAEKFPQYEVVSAEEIRHELTGDYQRLDINDVVFRELHRRTILKLELGERVVVDACNLRKQDRVGLIDIGLRTGVPIFFIVINRSYDEKMATTKTSWRPSSSGIIARHEHTFRANERDILKGDSIANVIDYRKDDFQVVNRLPNDNLLEAIQEKGFRGVMTIGDVHGMIEPLKNATEWATARGLFCVFLGDIVDYGPNSIQCVDHVYDVITRGRGLTVIGNHERKIERWLDQVRFGEVKLRLSEGNRVTTRAIEAMAPDARRRFETRYKALLGFSRHHWIVGNTLFTHGAAEPEMFDLKTARLSGKYETMALFGEVDNSVKTRDDGYPNRIYSWVDRIPQGKQVMVGHDIRSTLKPLRVFGEQGGEVYFMDTGCGKGGRLTSADMLFEDGKLIVKAFKYH